MRLPIRYRILSVAFAVGLACPCLAALKFGGGDRAANSPSSPPYWKPLERLAEIPSAIRSINFFSGIPLMGQGIDLSGGFGDVAANLVEAAHFAKAHPGVTVNFIVVSKWHLESRLPEASSERIAEIMVPGLDSENRDVIQRVDGINYLFFSEAFNYAHRKTIDRVIPKADLSINLSGGLHMRRVMEATAPVAITVEEPSGHSNILDFNAFTFHQGVTRRLFFVLRSGVNTTGLYLPYPKPEPLSSEEIRTRLLLALSSSNILIDGFKPNSEIALAYTKYPNATANYVSGVSEFASMPANRERTFYLFVKKSFVQQVAKNLPHNVKLYGVSGLPEATMRLLIQGCSLSPIITGDVSFSIALGAISPSKGLMLEVPSRAKLNSAQALTKQAAARAVKLGLAGSLEQAEEKFQTALMLSGVWSSARIAENLGARDVWQEFYVCVTQLSDGWQIMKNLTNYYHFFGLFQHEFNNSILISPKSGDFGILEHRQLLEFLLRELNQTANWNSFPERLMNTVQDESASLMERVYCLIALLKLPSVSPGFFELIHGTVWREAQRQIRLVAQLVRSSLEQEHFHSKLTVSLNGSPDGAQFVGALEDYLTSAGCAEALLVENQGLAFFATEPEKAQRREPRRRR